MAALGYDGPPARRTDVERLITSFASILQPLGAMTALLAIWIALLDIHNEFLPVLFVAALLLLGVGLVVE